MISAVALRGLSLRQRAHDKQTNMSHYRGVPPVCEADCTREEFEAFLWNWKCQKMGSGVTVIWSALLHDQRKKGKIVDWLEDKSLSKMIKGCASLHLPREKGVLERTMMTDFLVFIAAEWDVSKVCVWCTKQNIVYDAHFRKILAVAASLFLEAPIRPGNLLDLTDVDICR